MKRMYFFVVAAALTAATGAVACGPTVPPTTLPHPAPQTLAPSIRPPATSPPTPTPASTSPAAHTRARTLRPGLAGADVLAVQSRLAALGYWLGEPDGVFGGTTQQAVFALQKTAGLTADGVMGRETRRALIRGAEPRARSTSGHVIEIDLGRGLLLIVDDGIVHTVLNTSTGGGYTYVSTGVVGIARTPTGKFAVYSQIDGLQISPLGTLWRPKYFVGGYAVHGSTSVPPVAVSHGCVRVSYPAMDWIWAQNLMPLGTAVWVY